MFIVAACNPHRGDSMATHAEETWVRGNYNVRPLHPTLELLMWDYGALDSDQEEDYIRAKMKMMNLQLENIEVVILSDLIAESQRLMRQYALEQLQSQKVPPHDAEVSMINCYGLIPVKINSYSSSLLSFFFPSITSPYTLLLLPQRCAHRAV